MGFALYLKYRHSTLGKQKESLRIKGVDVHVLPPISNVNKAYLFVNVHVRIHERFTGHQIDFESGAYWDWKDTMVFRGKVSTVFHPFYLDWVELREFDIQTRASANQKEGTFSWEKSFINGTAIIRGKSGSRLGSQISNSALDQQYNVTVDFIGLMDSHGVMSIMLKLKGWSLA